MRLIDQLERKLGRFYIRGLMKYICFGMAGIYVLDLFFYTSGISASAFLAFDRDLILRGQVWRLVSFILIPPSSSPIFILLSLYFYYFLGTTLENQWGSRRFNLYYLIGIIGADIGGMVLGYNTNEYLNLSLFLTFACLYPDQEILLFFILPVKVRYIGYVDAAFLIYRLL
ncbi:MAG: rhomboid family intramembrane serine protease, partial [Clostridia bacterium]|nr:rhomboid family intramembrane serine protease [Clostridia bacterium]